MILHPLFENSLQMTRRQLLGRSGAGLGLAALATLLGDAKLHADAPAAGHGALPGLPHFPAKVRRVIYLMQTGAPSHVDLFDYKPSLARRRGELLPPSVQMGQRLTTMTQNQRQIILPGIAPFRRHGRSGAWLCDFMPH